MKRRTQNLLIILAILIVPLTLMSGLLINAVELPSKLKPFAWPLLALVTLALISIGVVQFVLGRDGEHPPPTLPVQKRRYMLARVRSIWITGLLEQSLHHTALITLWLQKQPESVANPWRLEMQDVDWSAIPLSPGISITQVYDDANGELLILGEPGVGKTTLLLELTRELLDRAGNDENHPMPVVFNLSSWAIKRQPLTDWLAEELHNKYQVLLSLAQSWVAADQVLPLLDGLDEVPPALLAECVEVINVYRRERGLEVPMVVCSRSADYLAQTPRVLLRSAVVIQPLTAQQIDDYLSSAGEKLAAVRVALQSDPVLQELASTPLMLSVLSQTYQGMSVEDIRLRGSLSMQRRQVFAAYVQRMLLRRGTGTRYTSKQTMRSLTWLASVLVLNGQTEFYLWQAHPGWLRDSRSRQFYRGIVRLLSIGLRCLIFGVIGGLVFGLLRLLPVEVFVKQEVLLTWLFIGFLCGFGIWLFSRLRLPARPMYDEGRWPAANVRVVYMLSIGLVGGLSCGLLSGLLSGPSPWLAVGLTGAAFGGLLSGLFSGLNERNGWIRELALRFVLWRIGYLPWNYTSFLDYAVERIFLRKAGDGYIFVHQLLLEYFATLQTVSASRVAAVQAEQLISTSNAPPEETSNVLQSPVRVPTLTGSITAQAPQHLNVYDIRSASPDEQLSVTTMAGLINRPQPQVYLINSTNDDFWLNEVFASVPHDTSEIDTKGVLDALLTTYRSSVQGMIIYDPDFQDSINIATTMAGQRDGIVVSPSQAEMLQQEPHKLPVLADLRTYHWHTRLQAYHWAQQNLLDNASKRFIAGLDPRLMSRRSFYVATRTFVYWLDSRSNRRNRALGWLSERSLMRQIFSTYPPGTSHLGWVIDERSGIGQISEAAMAMSGTDFFSNLEVWAAMPSPTSSGQQVSEIPEKWVTTPDPKIYVSFTMLDGDNLQYCQNRMLSLWRDPARGSVPIGWTISPLLSELAPTMAAFYMHTATPNDELIAGPSGAGYMLPSHWPLEYLPAFLQRTGKLMHNMNLSILAIFDKGAGGTLVDANLHKWFAQVLFPFGVRGLLSGTGSSRPSWTLNVANAPMYHGLGVASSVDRAVRLIRNAASAQSERPLFLNILILPWTMTPSNLKQVVEQLGSEFEVVTPGTLLAMLVEAKR